MIPLAPWERSWVMASSTSEVDCRLTVVRCRYPTFGATILVPSTEFTWILARVMVKFSESAKPARRTVIETSVRGSPRSRWAAFCVVHPCVDWPSTSTIWSPDTNPARAAGESAIGETTWIQPSRESIRRPTPP